MLSERLLQAEGSRNSEVLPAGWVYKFIFLQRIAGSIREVIDLSSAGRRFLIDWFKIPFLGKPKL